MAVKPAINEPVNQDMQAHKRDYAGFVRLFFWGAIASFVIGMTVVFIIS